MPVNNGLGDKAEIPAPQYNNDSATEDGEFSSSSNGNAGVFEIGDEGSDFQLILSEF